MESVPRSFEGCSDVSLATISVVQRGGAAMCPADLMAYSSKAGNQTIQQLATTGYWTAAW
jgi:hypothetical protein